jgi:hypothetical protein
VLLGGRRLSIVLDHDGFAKGQAILIDSSLSKLIFRVENRSADDHRTSLEISGPEAAGYEMTVGGQQLAHTATATGIRVEIPVPANGTVVTMVRRAKSL